MVCAEDHLIKACRAISVPFVSSSSSAARPPSNNRSWGLRYQWPKMNRLLQLKHISPELATTAFLPKRDVLGR